MKRKFNPSQMIHVRVDSLLYIKLKESGINATELVNSLLSQYFELNNQEMPEESMILDKMQELESNITSSRDELAKLSVLLTKIRKDKEKSDDEKEERLTKLYDAFMKSPDFKNSISGTEKAWR